MRRSTAFPGMGRDPAARSRVRVVVGEIGVVIERYVVLGTWCVGHHGETSALERGAHFRLPRTTYHAPRTSLPQPQHPLMRPERLQHERDVLIERGAELFHTLGDVLSAHPFGESLVL